MRARTFFLLAGVTVAGCRFGDAVEPIPITGDPPATVAIWPFVEGAEPPAAELWFEGLAYQLSRRGYRVVAPGVAREMLAASDLVTGIDDAVGVGRALMADAILQIELREFTAEGRGALQHARWDVVWRLLSTRGHGQQWAYVAHGRWRQADRDPLDSSLSFDEQQDPRPIVPIGGSRIPGFRDTRDLMAHLHRTAIQHLPPK